MILASDAFADRIDRAVFPGLQGGPHMHTIAGVAVALHEAAQPAFAAYARQVVNNAEALAESLMERGFNLVSGGTDNHLVLVDLCNRDIGGKALAQALDRAGLVCNYNTIPDDPRKPFDPSGIRLGTAAMTTRGFAEAEMVTVAGWIDDVARAVIAGDEAAIAGIGSRVEEMLKAFPAS